MKKRGMTTYESPSAQLRMNKILALLDDKQLRVSELAEQAGMDRKTIYGYLAHLRSLRQVHIAAYDDDQFRSAIYTKGDGEDAVRTLEKMAPALKLRADDQVEEDIRRALELQRRKMQQWKPHRDPLIAAFFGAAAA